MTLRELIESANATAEPLFKNTGRLIPFWIAITRDGELMVIPAPPTDSKDIAATLIRALFRDKDVVQYVSVCEAWVLEMTMPDRTTLNELNQRGLESHPDRVEVVAFMAESETEGMLTGRRQIERPARGKAKLGPLHVEERFTQSEGRMVGMLPRSRKGAMTFKRGDFVTANAPVDIEAAAIPTSPTARSISWATD